jgi:ligand-binding sensor domain-containing protein/two-component sensor histidine kinase
MNARVLTSLFTALFFFLLIEGKAKEPLLYFENLNKNNGLSHNKVNCIIQDKKGFTWIGTDDGLNRFDGKNFIIYKNIPGVSSSISGNTITDLLEDKEGIIWIATADGGLTRYNQKFAPHEQFKQYKHDPQNNTSIPVNIINAIAEDGNGIWLATSGAAVIKFDKEKEIFQKLPGAGNWTINDVCFDKDGTIWAGREGGSILKVNPKNLQWQSDPRYNNIYEALPHVVVTSIFKDSKDHIWFGSWDKAVYRHALNGKEENFLPQKNNPFAFGEDEAIAFNEDKEGRIWIGGKLNGLYVYHPALNRFYNYRHNASLNGSLVNNKINCIYKDSDGTIWIGTDNGISIYNSWQQQLKQEFIVQRNSGKQLIIYDFLKEKNGDLWIASSAGLVIRKKGEEYTFHTLKYKGEPLSITRFFKDDDGSLYLGTNYSVFKYNHRTGSVVLLPNTDKDPVMSRLIESRIVSFTKDTIDGSPVLVTVPFGHYFSYYDLENKKWISRKDTTINILSRYNIKDNRIRKIVKTSDGWLWMANEKNGLVAIDKQKNKNYNYINSPSLPSSISNNNVYDIKEDKWGNLWISTYGGGLNYFDRKKGIFRHFQSVNNLLEGLQIDENGDVWCISNGSLQKFDTKKESFSYYQLPDIEKTGGIKGYIYKDEDGKMYVSGPGYYISFLPHQLQMPQKQPQVFLTDLSIFNQSYSHLLNQKKIGLKHGQNFFTIHYAAPFYSLSAPVQYSYKLEGVDEDWIEAGSSTQAPYTNLTAGNYTFKVRATTTPGVWSEAITTLPIQIIPPFWKTWWFLIFVVLVSVLLVYVLYRYRINELVKRQAIRNKIAQDLHDQVGSTLSSISVYSQVAKIYNQKDRQHDLESTLERISSTSSEMISEMSDIVWAISPNNDNMATILQRMESYAKPLLNSKEIQCRFEYNNNLDIFHLPMEVRKNFYLIFKEAINNAIKYSDCKVLTIKVSKKQQHIYMTIQDDGKGFDIDETTSKASSSLSGNGLKNMKMRAKEMQGHLEIKSAPGLGTLLELHFPLK